MRLFLTPILVEVEDPRSVSSHDVFRERVIRLQQPGIVLPDKLPIGFICPQPVLPGWMHVSAGNKPHYNTDATLQGSHSLPLWSTIRLHQAALTVTGKAQGARFNLRTPGAIQVGDDKPHGLLPFQ